MTQAHPLHWPDGRPRTKYPQPSKFDTTFVNARDGLIREIELLGGRSPVVSSNIELRQDGLPYANRPQPKDRGVAVYFTYGKQSMCFACDRWDRVVDNLQAIRHTIAALRGIERWGTGEMVAQAFTGFTALPPPISSFEILGVSASASRAEVESAFRQKVKQAHPDCGGSTEEMQRLNQARRELIDA